MDSKKLREVVQTLKKAKTLLAKKTSSYKTKATKQKLEEVKSARKSYTTAVVNYKIEKKLFQDAKKKVAKAIFESFNAIEKPGITIKEFDSLLIAPFRDVTVPDQITLGPFTAKPLRTDEEIKSMADSITNSEIASKYAAIGLPATYPWEKREKDATIALFDNDKPLGMVKIKRYIENQQNRGNLLVRCNLSKRSVLAHRCFIAYALLNPKAFGVSIIIRSKIKPLLDCGLQFTPEVIASSFPKTVVNFYNTKLAPYKTRVSDLSYELRAKWPKKFELSEEYRDFFSRISMLQRFADLDTFLLEIDKPENISKS